MRSLTFLRHATTPSSTSLAVLGLLLSLPHVRAQAPVGLGATEWSSIRTAYESHRHAACAVPDGYQARNPGQHWLTTFDGSGFSTTPDAGGWVWGLELEHYGFAGAERDVSDSAKVSAQGERVTYDRDATLQEWWVNDARGLEHGFTVRERPSRCDEGPLTFTLAVRGDLHPSVHDDGRAIHFSTAGGFEVLTYTGLVVLDADDHALAARFECSGAQLRLSIDEHGARYPLTIDPIAQQAYLKASNTGDSDSFGRAVAISGDTVVVGANAEESSASGVNGNEADNSAPSSGAAYVFVRSGTSWSQQAYLKASNTEQFDRFGTAVSISGDTIVVGAYDEDSSAPGVNGNQASNSAPDSGAAYVFVRSGTTWSQQAYLKASVPGANDFFGTCVSVVGDTVVVGAAFEDSNATGVGGNPSNNSAVDAGAAYVFVRSGTTWSQQAYLKASNTNAGDLFGSDVSVSGDTVVVGALSEASNATGVNGNQSNNSATDAGAAYVFTRSGTTWTQQAYLKASNTGAGDQFGFSVSASGESLVVGAQFESSNATGVNGNQADNSAGESGAAYVFVRSGTTWSQEAYIKASNTGDQDDFGHSVSMSGNTLVVGAYVEDSIATGVDGDQNDENAFEAGAAYVFTRSGTTWSQAGYLKASNTGTFDFFGLSVAVSGNTVVAGAPSEDSSSTGVNGSEIDTGGTDTGAAYVFLLDLPPGEGYCFGDGLDTVVTATCPCTNFGDPGHGCANSFSSAGAVLSATGTTSPNTIVFTAAQLPNNNLTVGFRNTDNATPGGVVFGDGIRCQTGTLIRFGAHNSGSGGDPTNTWTSSATTVSAGLTRYYQVQYRNPSPSFCPPATFNITNGYRITW